MPTPLSKAVLALLLLGAASAAVPARAQTDPTGIVDGVKQKLDEATENGETDKALQVEELMQGDPLEARTWERAVERLGEKFMAELPQLVYAAVVLVVFFIFYLLVAALLKRLLKRSKADPALHYLILRLTRYALISLGLVMAAAQLGFAVGSLLAGLGVLGLAVGLAAQETLANLIAGITILWDRPFRTGDRVTIADTYGTVQQIGLRSTRIRTLAQNDAILPNKDVINHLIVNHTLYPQLRLSVPLGIAYKEDIREARKVLLAAVDGHPLLNPEPAPDLVATGLGDSSVDLELRVWIKEPGKERDALWAMVETSKIALDEAGIEIPFPQRTLHLGDERVAELLALLAERKAEGGGDGASPGSEEEPAGGEAHDASAGADRVGEGETS